MKVVERQFSIQQISSTIILIMQTSEFQMKAYISDGLNQRHGLDSPEGSAALLQANKPEVDNTDIQKARILDKTDVKQTIIESFKVGNQKKNTFR
ncbi:unnamed protein product [Rotaria magnacalcarata]|uniref:Uncharacterized protein n=1 Tax=Rotaria magnacalcarata TaxID=392030 RepID=A0A816QF73_9BILA|nr:unnamed protein product [Rotaria magnacalcarata]CAF2059708.1 unnamed protein product [Rotaria magnacalcarata]CAF2097636.1 unnamed protein product [Rotaria magnacalcarata]CAF2122072.1 unnamed protein product [Rotaria magnacalcarata]CAF3762428.1 unnamed protein product [Rotaria magnacalcarata]